MQGLNSYRTASVLSSGGKDYLIYDIAKLAESRALPYCLKILLENLLRHEDGVRVKRDDIDLVLQKSRPESMPGDGQNGHASTAAKEISFRPARTLMQDFTGVPAVVDLAALRDAVANLGGDPQKVNPIQPVELVIDHSVQVDRNATENAADLNAKIEFSRNGERYKFLKWGQKAFDNFKVVPPCSGIVHQVNLEYLARVVCTDTADAQATAYPDTLVGTDSHTTMINGLGVLGWGVGGIEAEAAMLGQPISILLPKVVGFELSGQLREGVTATDLVLTVVDRLRQHGVVGKFVEFFGDGVPQLSLGDRATIANMAPEYGATCGIFPVDAETVSYLRLSGRSQEQIDLVTSYAKRLGLWHDPERKLIFDETLHLDLGSIVPCLAGPKRPQDRIPLDESQQSFQENVKILKNAGSASGSGKANGNLRNGKESRRGQAAVEALNLRDGMVAIAAITSCTNTSNPSVMLCAGLLAAKAAARGLSVKPWVKTSLAPGSKVVTEYLSRAKVLPALEQLGFHVVGYGCTTCIGNSGPLRADISRSIRENNIIATAVLSGNRNFEGRIHPDVRMNYLASPPLVVAYAIAGSMNIDLYREPLGTDQQGNAVYLKDLWPSGDELKAVLSSCIHTEDFKSIYAEIFTGPQLWQILPSSDNMLFEWTDSTYIAKPPYFDGITARLPDQTNGQTHNITQARVLVHLGDSVTTDHISPAGAIQADSPAGHYLQNKGVKPCDFNSYGSRRGNHHLMMRGTFANIRLRNKLVPDTEGGWTRHLPSNEQLTIFDAAERYRQEQIPLIILAGKEYGSGSSRDWAAKGPKLLGVKAVIAESYERIHRSNLVGLGILPLQFMPGQSVETLGLSGAERYEISVEKGSFSASVRAQRDDDTSTAFQAIVRIDTPQEQSYYAHGGVLPYVLRQIVQQSA